VIEIPVPSLAPAEAARRAARGHLPFWLSSPGADDDIDIRQDFVGCDPARVVRGSSLEELEEAWGAERHRWGGGADSAGNAAMAGIPIGVGWLSYDLSRRWIKLPALAADDHGWPDLEFHFHDAVWRRDARTGAASILARDVEAGGRLSRRLSVAPPAAAPPIIHALEPEHPTERHLHGVNRILDYLAAGDAYQVNLARRLSAAMAPGDPVWLPATLREHAPAPHALWIAAGAERYLVGNSPERFLRTDGRGAVETRPIKGTRPRRGEARKDRAALDELTAAAKERAEHVMIVDLERNDLGRVCQPGSIHIEGLARVLPLPTVFHLVTTVRGTLRPVPPVGLAELVRATFPGGSVTGAPKQRAMEIIEELEPVRRGPYTGATGWLGAAGDLDLAVAIRTALVSDGRLSLSVGGGIVADSNPAAELAETEVKARAFAALCGR
jgi:para-aminobenzoate synthetase component 1